MVSHDTERGYNMVVPADLKSFLIEVKNADLINFIPTDKNRRTRLSLGLTT